MTTLSDLTERLEKATGPDRELDAAIAAMFRIHWTPPEHWINNSPELEFRPMTGGGWREGWLEIWMPGEETPRDKWKSAEYTRSIDAALALVHHVLPEATDSGHDSSVNGTTAYISRNGVPRDETWFFEAQHKSAAVAYLIALLRARSHTESQSP